MSKTIEEVVLSFGKLEKLKVKPLRYLIDPPIRARSVTQMFAVRETYKTLMAEAMAVSVATGISCIEGWDVPEEHQVLYVDGELPVQDIKERIRTFCPDDPLENLSIYPNDHILEGPIAVLTDVNWRHQFLRYVKEYNFKLIIFDNLSSLAPGVEENKKEDWSPITTFFLELKRLGIAVLFIHHAGKTSGMFSRGHSGLEDSIDTSILLEKPAGEIFGETPDVLVSFPKYRARIEMTKRTAKRYKLIDGVWKDEELGEENRLREVATYIQYGMPQTLVGSLLGVTQQAVSKWSKKLRERGIFDANGCITKFGSEWLERDEGR